MKDEYEPNIFEVWVSLPPIIRHAASIQSGRGYQIVIKLHEFVSKSAEGKKAYREFMTLLKRKWNGFEDRANVYIVPRRKKQ